MMRFGGYGHDFGAFGNGFGFGHFFGMLMCVAVLVLVIVAVIVIIKRGRHSQYGGCCGIHGHHEETDNALTILNERYAKGEITEDEYKKIKTELRK